MVLSNVRYAVRVLSRTPGFTLVVVVALRGSAGDAVTYAAVAVGLVAVAALASYVPARRASTVNPAESLAAE